jgi:hypothetical protein
MAELSQEWVYWCLVNGLPAALATISFLVWAGFAWIFAWNVEHRQSAIFLGTGFLFRTGLFVTILMADTWEQIAWMTWGNVVFAGVLLGVTLIYGERFHWRRFMAIGWLFLYIEEPVWMFSLVPEARLAAEAAGPTTGAALHPALMVILWIEVAVMLVVGVYLFMLNKAKSPNWPWKPDIVSQRILAGWPLGWAAWAATLALASTWTAAYFGVWLNIIWLAAVFLSILVFRKQFDLKQKTTRTFLLVNGLLLLALGVGVFLQSGVA